MSAFIVSKGHIRFLVEAGLRLGHSQLSWYRGNEYRRLSKFSRTDRPEEITASQLGALLWEENVKSVDERYREENGVGAYEHVHSSLPIDPVQVIKAADCYMYQACEHAAWETSEAKAAVTAIRERAIDALPGYESAAWGVPEAWENEDGNKVIALTDLMR